MPRAQIKRLTAAIVCNGRGVQLANHVDNEMSTRSNLLCKEVTDTARDFGPIFLKGKMARIEKVELDVVQISLVGMRTVRRKDFVVLAPHNQRRRLVLAEVGLPAGVDVK